MEKMLLATIIQFSKSQFSSPVFMIKKKDISFHFYVYYYPILVVKELLDGLFGATIFSKIDQKSSYHQIRVA